MPFPYFSSDKGRQTSAIIVRDPQDVLRKKSVQSCMFTLKTREVFTGRLALLGLLYAGVLEGLPGTCGCVCHPGGHDSLMGSCLSTDWGFALGGKQPDAWNLL